ncbi:sugar ABC transporter permease [bacterium 1xD42-62]|uniref:Sugar ABC transporter permease n=2 Tax=Parablautia muri TaxID=2320879 RepID=A0A9X5BCR6_9FIRM|nr:sugar ABC transporter permease [Parablautia muri]
MPRFAAHPYVKENNLRSIERNTKITVPSPKRGRKSSSNKKKHRGRLISAGYLLPSAVGVLLFFVLPFLIVVYYSMIDNPISAQFVLFDNFVMVFQNAAFIQAAKNTFTFSVSAVPLAVVLSLFLAMMLESKIPFQSQFRTFFLSPMMVPIASVVLIWQVLFHFNGMMNELRSIFDLDKIDWLNSGYAQVVIVILFLWKNLGYNMILFMAALSSIPKDILEVAILESASPFQVFIHIKLRYISSTILFVTIMSLINSFKVFREIYLLKGDYPYDTMYMLQHFMNNTFSRLDYQKMSAAAIMMAIVMVIIIGILFLTENYFGKDVEG